MKLKAKSKKNFSISKTPSPNKTVKYTGRVITKNVNIRKGAGQKNPTVSFSPLKRGKKVQICDSILSPAGNLWYYIKYKGHYAFACARNIKIIAPNALRVVNYLQKVHVYVKSHYKSFVNHYDGNMTSFKKAKDYVKRGKKVGLTCVVPLRFALNYYGIKNGNGKSLISAPGGSFKKYYTGDVKKRLKRITVGGPIGKTIKQAIDKGLLVDGDIVCYKNITHTSTYSGDGYKFYEGGGQCVKNKHYPNGIKMDYSKNYYKDKKIAEVLRWKF